MHRPPRHAPSTVSTPVFALCVVSIAIALHGVWNVALYVASPATTLSTSVINADYCRWRMYATCWASPNASLATYELLFPVTRDALFERGFAQRFQPLETRYDVAVVWNAMARCREMPPVDATATKSRHRLATLFDSLPVNASVDAWCGASLLAAEDKEPHAVLWLVPEDTMLSPFAAHKRAFLEEAATRDRQVQTDRFVEGCGALAIALALFFGRAPLLAFVTRRRANEVPSEARALVVNPLACGRSADAQVGDEMLEVSRGVTPEEPSWIDVKTPDHDRKLCE